MTLPDPDREREPVEANATAPPNVAVFLDLATRDGRRAVEVRGVAPMANGFFASPRSTLYSCGYVSQAERILALQRARRFCDERGLTIIHFGPAEGRRASWQ